MPSQDEVLQRIHALSPSQRGKLEQALAARGIDALGRRGGHIADEPQPAAPDATIRAPVVSADGQSLPVLIQAQEAGQSLIDWIDGHRARIDEALGASGGVLFRGFAVGGAAGVERCLEAACGPTIDYAGIYQGIAVRRQVHGKIFTSTEFSSGLAINLHSECSFAHCWPLRICFYCTRPAARDGRTPIADTRRVLRRVDPSIRARFEKRGVMYVRNYGIGTAPAWQDVFGTRDRGEVERVCRGIGVHADWVGNDRLRTRSVRPAVVRHPRSGEEVWFNHVNSAHVRSNNPALADALMKEFAPEDLPRTCFYGDGTEIETATLEAIRNAYQRETIQFDWLSGDLLLLDNMLTAHGRQPYTGEREVLVGMAANVRRESPESMANRVVVDL